MQLSVIIVNYNVKLFLEQCLCSVQKAISTSQLDAEVFVIDNASADDSVAYLQPLFLTVQFIANKENTGFAKACNQGLKLARGKYILFLNPDTIVPENCFAECMLFLDTNPAAGAAGIKMLDGSGKFLKESKRSFPSPLTAMYKLFGLAALFPHSKIFSKYHLGNLDENDNHEVDVLAGAFMMIKKEVLDKTGGFDETFFMYGEDVDLSYRIQQAGYKNYYFAGSPIIHFKGESTRKGTLNYIRMFYKAMSVFVKKHSGSGKAKLFSIFIQLAIWARASMSAISGFIRRIGLPLIDAILILLSFWLVKQGWNHFIKTDVQYSPSLLRLALPAFTAVYLLIAYYAGLYDRWYRRTELVRSTLIAMLFVLAGYSLLPEEYRFSRGIVFFGSFLAFVFLSIVRWILIKADILEKVDAKDIHPNTLVVGSAAEFEKTVSILKEAGLQERVLGRVAVSKEDDSGIGYWNRLDMLSNTIPFREVIFCEGELSFASIIQETEQLKGKVKMKFFAACSHSIIGSDSKDSSGKTLSADSNLKIGDPYNLRLKRLIDIVSSLLFLISFPVHFVFVKKPFSFFGNCFAVLLARKTWIGYINGVKNLPALRKPVISCNGVPAASAGKIPAESMDLVNYWYARDYEPVTDIKLLLQTYRQLGG